MRDLIARIILTLCGCYAIWFAIFHGIYAARVFRALGSVVPEQVLLALFAIGTLGAFLLYLGLGK